MAATMKAATFMGKHFSTIQSFIKNYEDLTLKQRFDVTAQLVNDQEEINGPDKIHWEKNSWKRLSLIGDETVIDLQSTKVYVFSDSVLCLERILQHPDSNEAWKNRVAGARSVRSYRDFDATNGESTEFEWNIFPGFTTLQLCDKIIDLLSDLGQTPETFTGRILFMSMFNDISCDRKGNKDECLANAGVVKVLARRFGVGQWSFIGPGSEKKWYSSENSPQGAWDDIAEQMLLEFAESGHPTFRATTPLSRGILKSKGHGKLSIHFAADEFTIETNFRFIISVNQLSVYGAVAAICEELENHQDGSGEPEILMGQSIVLGEIKAEVPLQNENPLNHQILWQQYIERIESLSPENRLSKFCKEAGFMRIVEVGQYFVTKDTGDFSQFRSVACLEYTLPRDDPSSPPKGWIQGHMRIGPVLESQPVLKTSNMELKFESGLWVKTILNLRSEYPMERSNMWSIQIKTIQKFLQIHKKIKCHKQVSRLLQSDQRQKQNHNRENLLIQQLPYRCTKEDGLTLSHQNKLSLRTISRRK